MIIVIIIKQLEQDLGKELMETLTEKQQLQFVLIYDTRLGNVSDSMIMFMVEW